MSTLSISKLSNQIKNSINHIIGIVDQKQEDIQQIEVKNFQEEIKNIGTTIRKRPRRRNKRHRTVFIKDISSKRVFELQNLIEIPKNILKHPLFDEAVCLSNDITFKISGFFKAANNDIRLVSEHIGRVLKGGFRNTRCLQKVVFDDKGKLMPLKK